MSDDDWTLDDDIDAATYAAMFGSGQATPQGIITEASHMNGLSTNASVFAAATGGFGGFLRCESCGYQRDLTRADQADYYANGWPRCCNHTMRWWTQRQIDAGEVPDLGAGVG